MQTDEEKVYEYLSGNNDSFKDLVDLYTKSIYNYSVRFVGTENGKDIVQDVFFKVWKGIYKFDSKKASFKTWIFNITRNTIIDYLKKKKAYTFSSLEDEEFGENIPDENILPSEVLIKLEDSNLLNSLIDKLPSNYKEVLILHYQEDMTFLEIGKLIDKPLNTVKSYHFRALLKLKEMLHQN